MLERVLFVWEKLIPCAYMPLFTGCLESGGRNLMGTRIGVCGWISNMPKLY